MNELMLIKNTLCRIEVRGEDNLRMILGCIEMINKMIAEDQKHEDSAE